MKVLSIFFLTLCLVGCNSRKNKSERITEPEELNHNLLGVYEYKTADKSENHYILLDTLQGEYNATYWGAESGGEHGIFYYGNKIENLKIIGNTISFQLQNRSLYKSTRFKIVKSRKEQNKDSAIGISKGELNYSGELSLSGINLICESKNSDCWDNQMFFERINE